MGRVDLLLLLGQIEDYVLIKKSIEFPEYVSGSDIDLVVFDKDNVIQKVRYYYDTFIGDAGEVRVSNTNEHSHIDFIFDNKLDIRIDLIDNFYFFENIEVKPNFIVKLFKDRRLVKPNSGYIYIPSEEDDLTVRYFEYLEYFSRYHNKIKHLEYLCTVDDEALKQKFFDNTHQFIQFKRKLLASRKVDTSNLSICSALKNIKNNLSYIISAVIRKILHWDV